MVAAATIVCPRCGRAELETMPTNACQFFYTCVSCGVMLKPLPGDCCVFGARRDAATPSAGPVGGSA